jgi:hypothetical protein
LDYLTTHTSLSPIRRGFAPGFVNYKTGCTRHAAANDKVYQLLAHGQWFSPGNPASSTTKTGRHDIAEILLTVALNIKKRKIFFYFQDAARVINKKSTKLQMKQFYKYRHHSAGHHMSTLFEQDTTFFHSCLLAVCETFKLFLNLHQYS